MRVRFVRVLGVRARTPYVHAIADGHSVTWRGGRQAEPWDCECLDEAADPAVCDHIAAVLDLLDPRVLGGDRTDKETAHAR